MGKPVFEGIDDGLGFAFDMTPIQGNPSLRTAMACKRLERLMFFRPQKVGEDCPV